MQKIIGPWELKKWADTKRKIMDKINSIVDMDTKISSMYTGKLRPRQITELFNTYYSNDMNDKIPQAHFIDKIIPFMQKLLDNAPKTFRGFDTRILAPGRNDNLVLTRPQVATIIAGVWFGLFDYNYITKGDLKMEDMPDPTFINIFISQNIFALQCLMNYFARVYQYMNDPEETSRDLFNAGNIIIKRTVLTEEIDWINSEVPISEVFIGDGPTVDDTPAKMQVAFAHEFIGSSDMFKSSLTQEEVMLLIRPECLVAALFCAKLTDRETITIMGAEKMSQYCGYGSSIRFAGNYIDPSPKGYSSDETEVMTQCAVVFMDASPRTSGKSQFIDDFQRDLDKAYCGFNSLKFTKPGTQIASGNWSYGFNGNNMQLKFIQQMLAASQASKCLIYHSFGRDFEDQVTSFISWIQRNDFTVGDIFRMYLQLLRDCYSGPSTRLNDLDVFECMKDI